ncbi:hypothetical protein EP331_07290 [bacterium]|nr:MAG: hypothetical protein EP331_07290 [bacterium]
MNPTVDEYLEIGCGRCKLVGTPECKVNTWRSELIQLRHIMLESGLVEDRKWGMPCYTYQDKNVIIVTAFKEFSSLSFFKGVLLKDEKKLLHKSGENSQSARFFKFTSVQEIIDIEPEIRSYIKEAIEIEKAGKKVDFKEKNELVFPDELLQLFDENQEFKDAFLALTPGRQRGYNLHFSAPKQAKTRISRIEKFIPKIMDGKGFFD